MGLQITSTEKLVKVKSNEFNQVLKYTDSAKLLSDLDYIGLIPDKSMIEISLGGQFLRVGIALDAIRKVLPVDSVNGVVPQTIEELYDMLIQIFA